MKDRLTCGVMTLEEILALDGVSYSLGFEFRPGALPQMKHQISISLEAQEIIAERTGMLRGDLFEYVMRLVDAKFRR